MLCSRKIPRQTPDVLKRYAEAYKANPAGWAFLTGTPAEVRDVAKHYGIYAKKTPVAMSITHFSPRSWIKMAPSASSTWESSLIRKKCCAIYKV